MEGELAGKGAGVGDTDEDHAARIQDPAGHLENRHRIQDVLQDVAGEHVVVFLLGLEFLEEGQAEIDVGNIPFARLGQELFRAIDDVQRGDPTGDHLGHESVGDPARGPGLCG